ncbi:MAG: hypothetical protein ACOCXA_00175, partial [Planctomycetota bacterium]
MVYLYQGGNKLRLANRDVDYGLHEWAWAENFIYGEDNPLVWNTGDAKEYQGGSQVTGTMDGLGRIKRHAFTPGTYIDNGHTYPDGTTVSIERNGILDPVRRVDRNGLITEWTYDDNGALISRTEGVGTDAEATWTWERNERGQMTAAIDANGNRTDYTYTDSLRLASIIEPADLPGGERPVTTFHYDDIGRLIKRVAPDGQFQSYEYDAMNRVVRIDYDASGDNYEEYVYGTGREEGLVIQHIDRDGNYTTKAYDDESRLVLEELYDADGTLLGSIAKTYLPGTHLVATETRDGDLTEYTYDGLNRRIATTRHPTPDTELTERRIFDLAGQQVATVDAYDRSTARLYDVNGRVVRTVQELTPGQIDEDSIDTLWKEQHPIPAPAPLSGTDVGSAIAGSGTESDGVWTIEGGGYEMWEYDDAFHLHARELPQDGTLIARLTSIERVHPWTKAGIMMRASDAPDAAYAFIGYAPDYGLFVNTRRFDGGRTDYLQITEAYPDPPSDGEIEPQWLRLQRNGLVVEASVSEDGENWDIWARVTLAWGHEPVQAGMAVLSHVEGTLATAEFDNLSIEDEQFDLDIGLLYAWYLPLLQRADHPQLIIQDTEYDPEGRMLARIDGRGIRTEYSYDGQDRSIAMVEAVDTADERRTEWDYDAVGNVTEIRQPRFFSEDIPAITQNVYTARNLLFASTEAPGAPEEATRTYAYTLNGKRAAMTDARGFTTTYQYDTCCDRLVGMVDPVGALTGMTYDNEGSIISRTDPLGHTTTTVYDGRDRVIAQTNPEGETTQYTYDVDLDDGVGLDAAYPEYIADLGFGPGADGSATLMIDATGVRTLRIMDGVGRILRSVDGAGRATTWDYDTVTDDLLVNAATDNIDAVTMRFIDGAGRTVRSVDAAGNATHMDYDANS